MRALSLICFAMATLVGCKKSASSSALSGAQPQASWESPSGTLLTLKVVKDTYFKNSLTMVRIQDASGALVPNPAFTGRKCGLRAGTILQFEHDLILPTNQKYVIGRVKKIENAEQATFDVSHDYCHSGLEGFLFKSDFSIEQPAADVTEQKHVEVVKIPVRDTEKIQKMQPDLTPAPAGEYIYPAEDSSGTYFPRLRTTTPKDPYVLNRTDRYNAMFKAYGHKAFFVVMVDKATVYTKDGRGRFPVSFTNKVGLVPRTDAPDELDLTSKRFRDWDGVEDTYVLLPMSGDALNRAFWCEQLTASNQIQRSDHTNGPGTASCTIPTDEYGANWLWIKCSDLNKVKTKGYTPLSCSSVDSSPVFVSKN